MQIDVHRLLQQKWQAITWIENLNNYVINLLVKIIQNGICKLDAGIILYDPIYSIIIYLLS